MEEKGEAKVDRNKPYCTAVVLAAGKGTRMGTETAKQYLEIGGKPVVVHALEVFQASPVIDEIILMTSEPHISYCRKEIVEKYALTKVSSIEAGGKERYETVWKALEAITRLPGDEGKCRLREEGYVFIHDGARPFIHTEILERACAAAEKWGGCVVGMPVKDTIKLVDENGCITASPRRSMVWQAQTPQVFHLPLIREAFQKQLAQDCSQITDDAMIVESQTGRSIPMVEGSYENIKITTPEDLAVAEALLKKMGKISLNQNTSKNVKKD